MDATVKCGNAGYGYGNSKPQMNYHRQSTESVTTVITEINRMSVNDKPGCGGAGAGAGGVQKQAYKEEEEVFVEQDQGSYGGYHGGGAVQKQSSYMGEAYTYDGAAAGVKNHGYRQEKYGEADGGYGAHYGAAAAGVKKQGYKQEACGETDAGHGGARYGGAAGALQTYAYDQQAAYGGGTVQQHGYQKDAYGGAVKKGSYQQHGSYDGECGAGYGSHYGGGAGVQTNGAYRQEKYGEADGGYGAHYGAAAAGVKKQGYKQEACGETDAGHGGAHYGGAAGALQTCAYDQQAAYGGGAVQQHGYQKDAYGGAVKKGRTDAGHGGAHYGCANYDGVMKKQEYKQYGKADGGYGYYGGGAGVKNQGYGGAHYGGDGLHKYDLKAYDSESESESDSDESDFEEAFPPRGPNNKQGSLHGYGYGAYKHEKHGAGNLGAGGVRRYESYEKNEEVGGGRRYQSYQSTTQEYTGGGAGGYSYGTCPPLNNSHLLS